MKITKIESQQKTRGRVNVFVDEEFSFGISEGLLIDLHLYAGKEVTISEIQKYKNADNFSKCLDKAYRFLSFRARSEREMREKLLEKFNQEIVEEVIARLKEINYLNDQDFACMWVRSRSSARGKKMLRIELLKKGIEKDIIDKVLEVVDDQSELETALKLVKSKEKYRTLTKNEAYKKVASFLMRRGYSYEIVKKVIEEVYSK